MSRRESGARTWCVRGVSIVLGLAAAVPVLAHGGIFNTWTNLYPTSQTGLNGGCAACHAQPGGGANWNAYGWQIRVNLGKGLSTSDAILACEPLDSDADPAAVDNIGEIDADTQPGWTVGPNNRIYFADGTFEDGHTAPSSIAGDLDPPACAGDLSGDLVVDVIDLLAMLAAWGPCTGCDADLNGDAVVDVLDLLELLASWGACP